MGGRLRVIPGGIRMGRRLCLATPNSKKSSNSHTPPFSYTFTMTLQCQQYPVPSVLGKRCRDDDEVVCETPPTSRSRIAADGDDEIVRETPPGFWDEAAWYYEPDLTPSPV